MFELWYGIVSVMLAAYVVLDGFDLGAGALHLLVARNDRERRTVLAAIGPFWDANEVWLLAAGGALFVAFPRALSAGLSGFYLAIFLVLWSLILRGVAIEFRSHVADRLWRGFWDVVFSIASALLPVLFGAALGNLVRGVPLTANGWFQLTLFTTFQPRDPVGTLDWYTVLAGVFSLVTLAGHGALYLSWRTSGLVGERSRVLGRWLYVLLAILWPLTTLATAAVNHDLLTALPHRPLALAGLVLALAGVVGVFVSGARRQAGAAFLASCAFITGMLVATAGCLYPVMLRSITDPALSITAQNAGSSSAGLRTALGWWVVGFPIVIGYFVLLFRLHRAKAVAADDGEGY
jgi:cytochrome bd ubiquinol oxidase subunit II